MEIIGYSDRLSVRQGESLSFMVSSTVPRYQARIVRLIHGDDNPDGPGFKEEVIRTEVDGEYSGREQALPAGSYVCVPDTAALSGLSSITLQAWLLATTPGKGVQGVMTKWVASETAGYGLFVDDLGDLGLWVGTQAMEIVRVRTGRPLRAGVWYFAAATFDGSTGEATIYQEPLSMWPSDPSHAVIEASTERRGLPQVNAPFLIAAYVDRIASEGVEVGGHFNGKIDSPCVFGSALAREDISALRNERPLGAMKRSLVAAWEFSRDVSSSRITDSSGNRLNGETVNMPMRAVTGRNWTGTEIDYRMAPDEYGAIYFHDDDLEDARWDPAFALRIPEDLQSGVYAARLRTEDAEDYVPFFVTPRKGAATAKIAFLVPTVEYLAYANEHVTWENPLFASLSGEADLREHLQEQDRFMAQRRLLSTYDIHSDGSGNCYSSWLRPILTMRPKYKMPQNRAPHNFNADLYVVDWLETKGFSYDVITEHDLHWEGIDLVSRYRVVVTGTKPEYWTTSMLEALEGYLRDGGRLMYLGGNGIFWPAGIHITRPHVVEVRRGTSGTLVTTWRSGPGEHHLSTTGEAGETMPTRGKPPQRYLGVGMSAHGHDVASPYRRQPGSFDPRAAFIFEGIGEDELIGDFGLVMGGAAGFEMDRADFDLGTPPHALILASSHGFHSDRYQAVVEEAAPDLSGMSGATNPKIRADIVFFEGPNGGGVFSVGSCCWCGALSFRDYDNNVSRMTENVLRRFVSDQPFGAPDVVSVT